MFPLSLCIRAFIRFAVMAMDPNVMYQNFPFLLVRLFDSLCSKKDEVAQESFQAILQVLKRCHSLPSYGIRAFLSFG